MSKKWFLVLIMALIAAITLSGCGFFGSASDLIEKAAEVLAKAPVTTAEPTAKPTKAPVIELPEYNTTEYEKYLAMSAKEQEKFIESFDSLVDFIEWYNDAEAEYERLHPAIEITDGQVDYSDIVEAYD